MLSYSTESNGRIAQLVSKFIRQAEDDLWAFVCHYHPYPALLLSGIGGFGPCATSPDGVYLYSCPHSYTVTYSTPFAHIYRQSYPQLYSP